MRGFHTALGALCLVACSVAVMGGVVLESAGTERASFAATPQTVSDVGVIFMTHLDLGFQAKGSNAQTMQVISLYMNEYLPIAIQTAADLRKQSRDQSPETSPDFRWTVHPYILSFLTDCPAGIPGLTCPAPELVTAVHAAVRRGDIQFHSGPCNLQVEIADADLFKYGLSMARDLADHYGVTLPSVLSHRDVPGMTRAVVPLLAASGVRGVSVGTNDGTTGQDVPNMFVWKDPTAGSNAEVLVAYHQGGYPDEAGYTPEAPGGLAREHCHVLPTGKALCFAFRMDNGPPPNATEVTLYFDVLRSEFPGAAVAATSFDLFFDEMSKARAALPVFSGEIGDTWINGVASDPMKHALFRIAARERAAWIAADPSGERARDPRVRRFSRFLLKVVEHTDGAADSGHNLDLWSNAEFEAHRDEAPFVEAEATWDEQRNFIAWALRELGDDHPLHTRIVTATRAWLPARPALGGFGPVPAGSDHACPAAGLGVRFGSDGSLTSLVTRGGAEWAGDSNRLAQVQYLTHSSVIGNQVNMTSGEPEDKSFSPTLLQLYKHRSDCRFKALLRSPLEARTKYGAPAEMWLEYDVEPPSTKNTLSLAVTLLWTSKQPTRLPESTLLSFKPVPVGGRRWLMDKMGSLVSPTEVVKLGATNHLTQSGAMYVGPDHPGLSPLDRTHPGFYLETIDSGLLTPYPYPTAPGPAGFPGLTAAGRRGLDRAVEPEGMAVYVHTNLWACNYPFWYPWTRSGDEGLRVRQVIHLVTANK